MEQLRNSRSGHLGTVTRTLNSIAAILAKNPKNINYEEVGKLEFALERCEEQEAKIWELDEQIIAKMMENNIETEQIEQENEKIDDSRFKNGSSIKTIKRLLARYESHNQSSSDSEDRNQVSSRNGLKLPKLNLPIFSKKIFKLDTLYRFVRWHRRQKQLHNGRSKAPIPEIVTER